MRSTSRLIIALGVFSGGAYAQTNNSPAASVQFVDVDKDVKLEVLDWGGSGRSLVFLAGLTATAHAFDKFAPRLTPDYHVYGITRRGFGKSSVPTSGYSADRLGDDVLAVIENLHLDRPVLVGHSLAGEELSSIGSRHPEKISGLIYLDAAYAYAYYDATRGDLAMDTSELSRKLAGLMLGANPSTKAERKQLLLDFLNAMKRCETDAHRLLEQMELEPDMPADPTSATEAPMPVREIFAGAQKYTEIHAPVLAIFAIPHALPRQVELTPEAAAKMDALDLETSGHQADAFARGVPSARIVRLAHADHVLWRSNADDVLREIRNFLASLNDSPTGSGLTR
jgi:non-heme chloroperoxidase